MPTIARFAVAATLVLVVIVVGVNLLPRINGIGGVQGTSQPGTTPGATPGVTPSATPSATPTLGTSAPTAAPSGTVVTTGVDSTSDLRLQWVMAPGWTVIADWALLKDGSAEPPDGMGISGMLVSGVYKDPCRWDTGLVRLPAHPTVDETVAVIVGQPSRDPTQPVDATLGGFSGKHLSISVPDDAVFSTCTQGQFRSYEGVDGGVRYHQGPGQIDELWVLDVDGTTVTVGSSFFPGAPPAAFAERTAIVDSMQVVGVPSPTPSGTPPRATPTSPSGSAYTWPGALKPGTYTTSLVWQSPVEATFTVPDGWDSRDVEIIKDPVSRVDEVGGPRGLSVVFSPVDNVYADPCRGIQMDPPVGLMGHAAVADALANIPGVKATQPVESSFHGLDATYVEITMPKDLGCAPQEFGIFSVRPEWFKPGVPKGGTTFYAERDHFRIWLVEQGTVYMVAALYDSEATKADKSELQDVVDSVSLAIPLRQMQFGACTLDIGGAVRPPAGPPIRVTLGTIDPDSIELQGMAPSPFPLPPPLALLNWTGDGWAAGRGTTGGAGLTPPAGSTHTGFVTSTTVNGYQGSFVFDDPGTWWFAISDGGGCFQQYPVEVLPAAGG